VGVGAGFYYSSTLDNPENKRFIDTMKAAGGQFVPSHFTAGAWASGSVLLAAVEAAGEHATDGRELARTIRATKVDAPWGTLSFNPETGYADAPTYYYTVVQKSGSLQHSVAGEMS
jgi:branched-chain amino acid transport system substrate-binding protein